MVARTVREKKIRPAFSLLPFATGGGAYRRTSNVYHETDKQRLDVLSQAIIANNTVYCSGAVGIDPRTGKLVEGTVADRTVRSATCINHPIHFTSP